MAAATDSEEDYFSDSKESQSRFNKESKDLISEKKKFNFFSSSKHERCLQRAEKSCKSASYVKFMLEAMKRIGCEIDIDRHLVCEPCNGKLLGAFDPDKKEIILCEDTIWAQKTTDDVLTHELIHAYDFCRVKYDKQNLRHLACTEVRAANLSGDCFFSKELQRLKFGFKSHQQVCVKERAMKSILCVRDVSEEEARKAVDSVFDACFKDTEPFERIPP